MAVSGRENQLMTSSARPGRNTSSELPGNSTQTAPFLDYPRNQPFIFDDYRLDPNKPIKAFPESSRKDIMSALRNLQEKVRQLQLEKHEAEENIINHGNESLRHSGHEDDSQTRVAHQSESLYGHLDETQRQFSHKVELKRQFTHGDGLQGQNSSRMQPSGNVRFTEASQVTNGIHSKLEAAEERCQLLEQQLDSMRRMVSQAELDRSEALRKSAVLRDSRSSSTGAKYHSQVDKLVELEREQLRLTAMQTLAAVSRSEDNKIQELEEKLQTERHYRRLLQTKSAELESAAEANRILLESDRANKIKKKKRVPSASGRGSTSRRRSRKRQQSLTSSEHFHLNLAEIPFINGKSTGRSYSLSANFQEVLSLMKSHNPRLCRYTNAQRPVQPQPVDAVCKTTRGSKADEDNNDDESETEEDAETTEKSSNSSLLQLLHQLQDEFGHMSFEHEELLRQIQEASDLHIRNDLERELDSLVARMEVKGDQIARLRCHQEMATKKKRKSSRARAPSSRPISATNITTHHSASIKSGKRGKQQVAAASASASKAQGSLVLLKDLKRIQASLRADDICWDC